VDRFPDIEQLPLRPSVLGSVLCSQILWQLGVQMQHYLPSVPVLQVQLKRRWKQLELPVPRNLARRRLQPAHLDFARLAVVDGHLSDVVFVGAQKWLCWQLQLGLLVGSSLGHLEE